MAQDKKIIRVEFTNEDGTRRYLDDAQEIEKWQEMLRRQAVLAFKQGYSGVTIKWKFKDIFES